MPHQSNRRRALALALLFSPTTTLGATLDWLPTAPTPNFSDPANWSTGTAPTPADTTRFDTNSSHTVSLAADTTVNQLTVVSDAPTLDLAGHNLNVTYRVLATGSPSGSFLALTNSTPGTIAHVNTDVVTLSPVAGTAATLTIGNAVALTATTSTYVGNSVTGGASTLTIENGGSFSTYRLSLPGAPESAIKLNGGTLRFTTVLAGTDFSRVQWNGGTIESGSNIVVNGPDQGWNGGGLNVGPSLDISTGKTLALAGTSIFIDGGGTLSATGGRIIAGNDVYVSANSTGTLLLRDGAVMTGRQIRAGSPYSPPAGATYPRSATVVVDNSTLSLTENIYVGGTNAGNVSVRNGGTASVKDVIVGSSTPGSALSVDGSGSHWTSTGTLAVGNFGEGSLSITNGAKVSSATAVVGLNGDTPTTGYVTATGPGTSWTNTGTFRVAAPSSFLPFDRPLGVVAFSDHASLSTQGLLAAIGPYGSASLTFTSNASLTVATYAYLGASTSPGGSATLSLTDSSATIGTLLRLRNPSATSLSLTRSTLTVGTLSAPGSLDNAATIILADASTLTLHGPLTNPGTVTLSPTSRFIWTPTGSLEDALPTLRAQLTDAHIRTDAPSLAVAYTLTNDPTAPTFLLLPAPQGDANLDGLLTPDDYALLDRGYARNPTSAFWTDGDFNYDGAITPADYLLIDTAFLSQAPGFSLGLLSHRESQFGAAYVHQLLIAIPEPSAVACLVALLPLLPRSHRKS